MSKVSFKNIHNNLVKKKETENNTKSKKRNIK